MATFVLIHGGGGTASGWDLVGSGLIEHGHDVVATDLPCDDPAAGWPEYTNAVVNAIGERTDLVVVAHSAGGFVAPLACERLPAKVLVLVAGMIPAPGETFEQWWENTDHGRKVSPNFEDPDLFYHDVPPELTAADTERGEGRENFPEGPWPMDRWPDVPTKFLLCRDDRVFPPEFMRKVARERLGIGAREISGGHCVHLSRPEDLADRLDTYWKEMQWRQ